MKTIRVTIALLLLAAIPATAEPVQELTEFTATQVRAISAAINEVGPSLNTSPEAGDFTFRRFFLRVTAKVGFDIEAVKLELLPELELVWQKEKPKPPSVGFRS